MSSIARTRRTHAQRRDELIDAASVVASDLGLDRVTVRDVARVANVTPGLIHHYFPSIDELLSIVFRNVVGADLARLHDGLDSMPPDRALDAFMTRMLAPDRDEALAIWLSAWIAASRRPGVRDEVNIVMERGAASLAEVIQRGVDDGAFTCADPHGSAARILIVADGVLIQRAMHGRGAVDLDLAGLIQDTVAREVTRAGT